MRLLLGLITGIVLFLQRISAAAPAIPSALSIPPDQYWDGVDGNWSTFGMQLGSNDQTVRLLPANSQGVIWTVVPDGCISTDPANCGDLRGGFFLINRTTTWNETGLFQLGLITEQNLGYSGNGLYGTDKATLGWAGDNLPTVPNAIIGGIATKDFYLGALPLNPWPVNFTSMSQQTPSLLTNLKNQSSIPSLSWGYTAGMYTHVPPILGSLTLGGYDASRFTANDLNFTMGGDISRDLQVAIQTITVGSTNLLSTPTFAIIDSLVPHIWLPIDACQQFESVFGLTWNDTLSLYLVNDTLHQSLLSSNPTVRFTIGIQTGGSSVAITMPYASFDFIASPPFVDTKSRYFPLKRADNSSQVTLGRAFLQNAYVIANYEYFNFSVSAAQYPDTSVSQQIVSLPGKGTIHQTNPSSISTGTIIGIAIGTAAVIVALVGLIFCLYRKRQSHYSQVETPQPLDTYPKYTYPEMSGEMERNTELTGTQMGHELQGTAKGQSHIYATHAVELPVNEIAAAEFHTPDATPYTTPLITPTPGSRGRSTSPMPPLPTSQGWSQRRPLGSGQ